MQSLASKLLPKILLDKLQRILDQHNGYRAGGKGGKCSTETRYHRAAIIRLAFAQLWEMGNRLPEPTSLGGRHIELLMQRWDQEGVTVKVLHTRISYLRTFSKWIGKEGMVKDVHDYLPERDLKRREAASKNRAWLANGVDPQEIIAKACALDERLGLVLALQDAFALRMKEAIEMRPAYCLVESGKAIEIYEGTKGGRLRRVDLDSDYKREVFEWARSVAAAGRGGRVRWPNRTWKQARRYYYYVLAEKLGVNIKEMGVSSHGLRHQYAQDKYQDVSGQPPPISGVDPRQVDPEKHREASIQVARDLGHGRAQVSNSYYGTHGHRLRQAKRKPDTHPVNSGQGEAK